MKMSKQIITALLLALLAQGVFAQSRGIGLQTVKAEARTPFKGGYYRALIIGNSVYRDRAGEWPSLKTAVSDARAVSTILQKNYGFSDIETLENATRRDVLKALDRLSSRALPEDNILVYYAGHGFLDDDTRRGFWVPVDAEGDDSTTYLRNSTIRDELNLIARRSRHTLLISDSCFSGTLLREGTRGVRPAGNAEQYFKKVSNKKSVQILTAGGVEFVDDNYQSSGHSPFTYFLLNELKNNDRKMLTVSELSNNVTKMVANNVEQVPQSGVLQGAGDELGEFIFIKLDVTVDGIDPDKVRVDVNIKPGKSAPAQKTSSAPKARIEIKHQPKIPLERPHLPMPTL
jgi:hypothetical protein